MPTPDKIALHGLELCKDPRYPTLRQILSDKCGVGLFRVLIRTSISELNLPDCLFAERNTETLFVDSPHDSTRVTMQSRLPDAIRLWKTLHIQTEGTPLCDTLEPTPSPQCHLIMSQRFPFGSMAWMMEDIRFALERAQRVERFGDPRLRPQGTGDSTDAYLRDRPLTDSFGQTLGRGEVRPARSTTLFPVIGATGKRGGVPQRFTPQKDERHWDALAEQLGVEREESGNS